MAKEIELVVVSRQDCCLCEEMEAVVRELAEDGAVRWRRVDVDSDADLQSSYGDQVPVLLVNGRKAFKYRVAPEDLRRRIAAEQGRPGRRGIIGRWRRLRP